MMYIYIYIYITPRKPEKPPKESEIPVTLDCDDGSTLPPVSHRDSGSLGVPSSSNAVVSAAVVSVSLAFWEAGSSMGPLLPCALRTLIVAVSFNAAATSR